jgi:c-di-GMP-binding flagellar brake protein YcgR
MSNNKETSSKSIDSLKQVYSSLQELLAGTRDSYRMEVYCELYVEMNDGNNKSRGKIVNLSTEGASIELLAFDKFPKKKTELDMFFSFNESSELLYSHAKVVWTKEHIKSHESQSTIIGVTFIDIDELAKNCIWNYIIDNVPIPFQPVSK